MTDGIKDWVTELRIRRNSVTSPEHPLLLSLWNEKDVCISSAYMSDVEFVDFIQDQLIGNEKAESNILRVMNDLKQVRSTELQILQTQEMLAQQQRVLDELTTRLATYKSEKND